MDATGKTDKISLNVNALLHFEERVRKSSTLNELGFTAVNGLMDFIRNQQAFFFVRYQSSMILNSISGLNTVDRRTPFAIYIESLCNELVVAHGDKTTFISKDNIKDEFKERWSEWLSENILYFPCAGVDKKVNACLILVSPEALVEGFLPLFDYIGNLIGYSVTALRKQRNPFLKLADSLVITKKKAIITAVVILLLLQIPVKQSVIAQAETTPLAYKVITAPMEGVVKQILVKPYEAVKKGQLLMTLDDITLKNKLEILRKSYGVAKTEALLSEQKAFSDQASKGEVSTYNARVQEKESELSYMADMLGKIEIRAMSDGVAMFNNPADWEGKPVVTGEKIMALADEKDVGILAWLPVADAIYLEDGAEIKLFLNMDPLNPRKGNLIQSSYQTVMSPNGISSYKILGAFTETQRSLKLGLRGTAKIYGSRKPVWFYLFRKPIAAARGFLGI